MPAKSEKQAKFFRVVKAIKKGDLPKNKGGKATKVAKDMTNKQINKYTKVKENTPDVNTDFSVGTDFSANLEEIIQLALVKKTGVKPKKPSYTSTKDELPANYNPMTGKFTESFTDKYDDNPKLKGKQSKLPDALQKAIIKKKGTNEHHLKNNPNAKYVATAAPQGWFDVWEGEPFDITGEKGVLVRKFKTMKDAKDYANIKNAEQGKLEEDLDLGHQDNEPHMLKKDLYRIAKYATELYQIVNQFDNDGMEVDFPHWWQAKIIKSKDYLVKAKHYLDGELKVNQIDDMLGEEFEYSDQAKAALEKIKNKRAARYQYNQPKTSDPTIAQRGGHDKVYKDYLKEDANRIIALEKERERLMADMEQEAEPGGGPIADEYGAKLDRIDNALAKLKGTQKQYKVLSTAELNKLARIKR